MMWPEEWTTCGARKSTAGAGAGSPAFLFFQFPPLPSPFPETSPRKDGGGDDASRRALTLPRMVHMFNLSSLPTQSPEKRKQKQNRQMEEGLTQAPPLLSESDLIGLMDKQGIGTDATIAEHIQKIQQRKVWYMHV